MREIVSILSATMAGSLLLQGYIAMWHPSSYGRFAELPAVLLYAVVISTIAFLVFVLPSFALVTSHTADSVFADRLFGWFAFRASGHAALLCAVHWPMHPSFFVAGAVGVSIYARLVFKRVG